MATWATQNARAPEAVGEVRERGRVRQGGTGGIGQFVAPPATTREGRRDAQSLPRRTPNRREYSDTRMGIAAR